MDAAGPAVAGGSVKGRPRGSRSCWMEGAEEGSGAMGVES